MPLDRNAARQRIQNFDFTELFTQELGWDWHKPTLPISLAGQDFTLQAIAEKRGFVAWHYSTPEGQDFPDSALRRRIEHEVTKATHEHLVIFTDAATTVQVWQWVRRESGKSLRIRETTHYKGQSGEPILQKLAPLFVSLDEEENLTLVDVTSRVAANVAERVTKRFYEEFRKHHAAFLKFITGIPNQGDHEWYTSIMLNRLMFLYFVQRKGFLDGDPNYLSNRLQKLKAERGENQFYDFYRYFLLKLFHGALNKRLTERDPELEKLLGRVPYLNGGIFDVHTLERTYGDAIQIPDQAFEAIFAYFNEWDWHLDERPLHSEKEINPDVLGYIFEKYINQKQMGAYYTKEDVTEYIGKNTILPFLFDTVRGKVRAAFDGDASVWKHLQSDPDRYIYKAVRHGLSWDYQPDHPDQGEPLANEHPFPEDIANGLDSEQPNLLKRRKPWNKPAPATHGLPTEIWRETIARRQRCEELREKLASGKVHGIDDFITLNLDLRRFTLDVIDRCDSPELLAAFWHALAGRPARKSNDKPQPALTILDPTCGSGAFLFAALNILEPLYEACLDRMAGQLADAHTKGITIHPDSHLAEFKNILKHVAVHPSEPYFIFKTIILHNLYGVDLMEEAVEICKLRLFLKLAAQVESNPDDPNLGIEPLPDIDFNIRAGNTLVGYATRAELESVGERDLLQKEEVKAVLEAAEDAASAYTTFIRSQLDGENPAEFKRMLIEKFGNAREQCDQFLAESYQMGITEKPKEFAAWKLSHQPFHWFVEFFGILNSGGFDVIIGNPPYVVNTPEKVGYKINDSLFSTYQTKNLYAFVCERSMQLGRANAAVGMIVQLTALSAEKMAALQDLLLPRGMLLTPAFPRRPESIFDGVEMPVTILLSRRAQPELYTTRVNRFYTEQRPSALNTMTLTSHSIRLHGHRIAKIGLPIEVAIYQKLQAHKTLLGSLVAPRSNNVIYYQEACRYWVKACVGLPFFRRNGERMPPPHGRTLNFSDPVKCALVGCLMNSSLFYWFYSAFSDCEHINDALIRDFRIPPLSNTVDWLKLQSELAESQKSSAVRKSITTKQGHTIDYDEMDARNSKPIFDEIDAALAERYGFTSEELDFIVNYDIKYRFGQSGEEEKRMSKNTGIPYEILTQQIFQALHDQDQLKNIKTEHNVTLQGKTLEHQIDVYWEYELGGIVYRAAVQTKDWAQTVSQGHLLTFKGVLDDLPGQPRGIFVTRTGYQSGAETFAKAHGILLYELREPTAKDMEGRIMTIHVRGAAFIPNSSNVQPIFDQDWVAAETNRLGFAPGESAEINCGAPSDQMFLLNEEGHAKGSFYTVINSMFPQFVELPETVMEHRFSEPTFMLTCNPRFPRIKLLGIRASISLTRQVHETILHGEDFIGFIMHDVIGDKTRLIDKQHRPIKKP